jgi:hypothetical protein
VKLLGGDMRSLVLDDGSLRLRRRQVGPTFLPRLAEVQMLRLTKNWNINQ